MTTLNPSTPAGRPSRAMWCWLVLAAVTQMGMSSRGCLGGADDDGSGNGGSSGGGGSGSIGGCDYGDRHYAVGESPPATDGCGACVCSQDGSMLCTLQVCLPRCGGVTGAECPRGQYCNYGAQALCGRADYPGTCEAKPTACTEQYDPVCGCDGRTYSNDCGAAAEGASVASRGACGTGGTGGYGGAGGYGGTGSGGYSGSAGSAGTSGTSCADGTGCLQPPCACLDSDGDNQCDNHCPVYACVSGQCVDVSPQPTVCGGLLGTGCAPGEFCKFLPEARCGAADATGECADQPEICTDQYDPVCGCDGKTYGNACNAQSAGVSVAARGECGASGTLGVGESCGGFRPANSATCAAGLFCQYQAGALCGAADAPGECVAIPSSCPSTRDPVCGCNGITYTNACNAALAQAGILQEGRCN